MTSLDYAYTTQQGQTISVPALTAQFLDGVREKKGIFLSAIEDNLARNPVFFCELAENLLSWAKRHLGDEWLAILVQGYGFFVMDVNRHQHRYEKEGRYRSQSYQDVYSEVYGNAEFMKYYHWGVYVTTFAWEHHLKIMEFFRQQFLPHLRQQEVDEILEFGAGSGVWSLLLTQALEGAYVTGVDISPYSVQLANNFVDSLGRKADVGYIQGDALTYKSGTPRKAVICCFLAEHLERPDLLIANIRDNMVEGGYAFITTALTAAESDHIYEFRRESEVVKLMEEGGFRVVASFSSAPPRFPRQCRFVPRSIAVVVQKRHNDWW